MKKRPLLLAMIALFMWQCHKDNDTEDEGIMMSDNMLYQENAYPGNELAQEAKADSMLDSFFIATQQIPVSTFSVDADGAAYAIARKYLKSFSSKPPSQMIRMEEYINYFNYDYPEPTGEHPISVHGEICETPWNKNHKLLKIGIQGQDIPRDELPASNFVLLIDVSGSMSDHDKLPLLKSCFKTFADHMQAQDRLAIVTYSGKTAIALNSTPGNNKNTIKNAIDKLNSGGGTAGGEGIQTAYQIAEDHFIEGGNNRVILGTDGDFNIGISSTNELVDLIEAKRKKGIFLTTLGVGTNNLNDEMLEQIADNGNGTYEYLDTREQGNKVFIEEYGKFFTVAKDVKVQIAFNPDIVSYYKLLGYFNRRLENRDFEDDTKDAGEIGSGQSITALYEIITINDNKGKAADVKFRYKKPDEDLSRLITTTVNNNNINFEQASENTRFAVSVAGFCYLLQNSTEIPGLNYPQIIEWADQASSYDPHGYKAEYIDLLYTAKSIN